jgi:ATP/maltotriose-dependent transcriptional regulator MalT
LLSPKITRPRVQRVSVRARLFRLIDRAREIPLVWVVAPPGAGKTTLVSHYLEQRRRKHLWYQVDAGDHDIAGLFNYLSRAADALLGRARRTALPLYAPEYLPDVEAFFRMFFRALFERLPDNTSLIFDDYQELADDAAFHRALCIALEEMPHGRQNVINSRNVAPPAFARLSAGRRVAIIDWEALKLTREETRRLVALQRKRSGGALSETLHAQCEGWITGFILLLDQSRAAPVAAPQSRLPAAVAEYFEQIFDRASPELRRLWLRTAYLPSFTASTAARVSGMRSAPALVETLAHRQFFLNRHGSGSATLQYHALWRDFLLHTAEAEWSSGERLRVMRRSAAALRDQGDHELALEIFFGAKDWRSAARLLLDSAEAFLAQGRWQTLHAWVLRLPQSTVAASPVLLYWAAVCQAQIDPSESLPAIERAYEAFSDVRDEAGQALCASLAIASNFAEWGNFTQRHRWFRILEQLLARDPKFSDPVSEARAWSALLFVFSLETGDFPFAEVCARRVRSLCRAELPDTERLAAASHLFFYLNQVASAEEAREALQEFAPLAASDRLTPLQKATWYLSESTYFYHVGDTPGARQVNH